MRKEEQLDYEQLVRANPCTVRTELALLKCKSLSMVSIIFDTGYTTRFKNSNLRKKVSWR